MAKYCGNIGFTVPTEIYPDCWDDRIIERTYFGDVIRNISRWQQTNSINDDITLNNQISILADPYANENFAAMRYATFNGTKWKVLTVEIQYPRLILTLGGVWNETTET